MKSRLAAAAAAAVVAVAAVAAVAPAVFTAACTSTRGDDELPFVQPSSDAPTDVTVRIASDLTFVRACVAIDPGETVEWENTSSVPVNVTGFRDPETGALELFSPNLVGPAPRPGSSWKHTFASAGMVEYYDSNSGSPGREVRDPYYGTITYVGVPEGVTRGTVCVRGRDADSDGLDDCETRCCNLDAGDDCPGTLACTGYYCE